MVSFNHTCLSNFGSVYFGTKMVSVLVASPATIKITTTLECVNVIYFSRNRSIRTTTKYLYKTTLSKNNTLFVYFLAPPEGRVSPFLSLRRGGSVRLTTTQFPLGVNVVSTLSSVDWFIKPIAQYFFNKNVISIIYKRQ